MSAAIKAVLLFAVALMPGCEAMRRTGYELPPCVKGHPGLVVVYPKGCVMPAPGPDNQQVPL